METVGTKRTTANCDRGSDYRNARTDSTNSLSNINAVDFIFAGTYGRGMFRSTDSGQNWQQINNGLLALYESALAINTNGYIFVELTL